MASTDNYLKSLADQYYKSMRVSRPGQKTSGGSLGNPLSALATAGLKSTAPAKIGRLEGAIGPQSKVGKVIDVLSRPAYAVGNVLDKGVIDPLQDFASGKRDSQVSTAIDRGDNIINTLFNASVGAGLSGLGGRSKVMPSDAIFEDYQPTELIGKVAKGVGGFAADVGLDPLTYIPAGAIASVGKKIPGVVKTVDTLKQTGNLAKGVAAEAKVIPTPESIARPKFAAQEVGNALKETKAEQMDAATPASFLNEEFVGPKPQGMYAKEFKARLKEFKAPTVKAAASRPRDSEGKLVYDFKKLPRLYVKPEAPAKTKPINQLEDWANANRDMSVTRTDEGKIIFSDATDEDAATLGEVLTAALSARETTGKADLTLIGRLFQASEKASVTGTSKSTSDAVQAAGRAAGMAAGGTRKVRVTEAAKAKRLAVLKDKLSPEDYKFVIAARSADSEKTRVTEILNRVHSPIESSSITEAPEESVLRQLLGQEVAPTEIAPRQVLNPTDPSVQRAVAKAANEQFDAAGSGYKYRSGVKDVARTNVKIGKGRGIADRGFNKRAQYHVWQGLINDASKRIKALGKDGPKGMARGNILRESILPKLDEAEAVLRSRGIEPILGEGHSGIALSFGDVVHALDTTDTGTSILLTNLFDINKAQIAPTALMDATQTLFEAMKIAGVRTTKDIPDFLKSMRVMSEEGDSLYKQIGRSLVDDPGGTYAKTAEAIARRGKAGAPAVNKAIVKRTTRRVWDKKHGIWVSETTALGGKELQDNANKILTTLTSHRVVTELVKRNIANSERYGAQLGYEVQRITEPVVEEFFKTWLRPTTSTGEAIAAYRSIGKASDAAADAIDATSAARNAADDAIHADILDQIAEDIPAIQNIQKVLDTDTVAGRIAAGQATYDDFVAEAVEKLPAARIVDVGENIGAAIDHSILRSFFPFMTKTPESLAGRVGQAVDSGLGRFIAQASHATLRPALTGESTQVRNLANYWRSELTDVANAFPVNEDLATVFAKMQQGLPVSGIDDAQQVAIDKFSHLVHVLFEASTQAGDRANSAASIWFRNALDVQHVNGKFIQMKLPEHVQFDVDSALIASKQSGRTIREELADQWKTWQVDDPIDFMARMQSAAASANVDAAIGREAARIAKSRNLMSPTRREGFVQIMDTSEKSVLTRYLPDGAWYHPDIVDEIKAMDSVLQQSLSFTSPFGMWVNRYMDPFLNMWKSGMTIFNPGHHVRNLTGDSHLSFQADGLGKIHQARNATVVMGMRGNYDDFSALRALQDMPADAGKITERSLIVGDKVVAKFATKSGSKTTLHSVTAKEVNDFARSHGMLVDYLSGEDLLQSADRASASIEAIQNAMKITGGRAKQAASRVSESREDYVRLTHFLQIIEKPENQAKFKSAEELMQFAVTRVRKWHPDGTDLAAFESKVMRRLFPFYSWTKKSIPLVIETMVMQPGRILAYPKAMYNIAQASGIDINSMGDPFPEDQLFPSFLTENMTGPQVKIGGNYYGGSPGIPTADLMSQFLGNPGQAAASMLTPFIKTPIELKTGKRLDTGGNIKDKTEYIASLIPGLTKVNTLTGTDTIGSAVDGRGIQPLQSVEKTNADGTVTSSRGRVDPSSIANYLAGLGITNMSKPSFINYAEIEKAKKAKKEAEG